MLLSSGLGSSLRSKDGVGCQYDIMHRLDDGSKFEWCDLMLDVEDVFTVLAYRSIHGRGKSAVAECDRLKKQTCWLATVEIDVMTCIFRSKTDR